MPRFEAKMRVAYAETWAVEAKDAEEANAKFAELTDDVIIDEDGAVQSWEVIAVEEVSDD